MNVAPLQEITMTGKEVTIMLAIDVKDSVVDAQYHNGNV